MLLHRAIPALLVLAASLLLLTPAAAQQVSAPYTITAPGNYTLSSDCSVGSSQKDCTIMIAASGVNLDGDGHTLLGGSMCGIATVDRDNTTYSGINIKNIWIEGCNRGIMLTRVNGATIRNVTIIESISDGLHIGDAGDIRVEDSVFLKNMDLILDPFYMNFYHGGIVLENSHHVIITRNTLEDQMNGIVLLGANGTTISSNYFHNECDVRYHSAKGSLIANNYLSVVDISDGVNNSLNFTLGQGTSIIGSNKTGGNYWYRDDGSGYSQTCVDDNHSGICDLPYIVPHPPAFDNASHTDFLPLCGQVSAHIPVHTAITPKAMHTVPDSPVYHQISPTATASPIPFEIVVITAIIGGFIAHSRR